MAPMCTPMIADYFKKSSIGKAHVIGYIGFVIGEVTAVGVLFRVTEQMNPQDSFFIIGIMTIILSSAFLCMIREPKIRKSKNQ